MDHKYMKKDLSPYIIFKCPSCHNFLYFKQGKKSKTCTRCNKRFGLKPILANKIMIVKGMTAAVNKVKVLQNQRALKELGEAPKLHATNQYQLKQTSSCFITNKNSHDSISFEEKIGKNRDYESLETITKQIKLELWKMFKMYGTLPAHVINLIFQQYNISNKERSKIINKLISDKILLPQKNNYFIVKDLKKYFIMKGIKK
ncbi:MAG: DUF1922 domain-containing protein [Promethearchaeota archaeon]